MNYQSLSKVSIQSEDTKENIDLASLFFDNAAQTFDLAHGYRAQTHLGSQLMYHSITEAAKNVKRKGNAAFPQERELLKYIEELVKVKSQARVFIFGSIFGGTGASSIPVIPTAFNNAYNLFKDLPLDSKSLEAKFGASLLTEYFKFKSPTDSQKKEKKKKKMIKTSYYLTKESPFLPLKMVVLKLLIFAKKKKKKHRANTKKSRITTKKSYKQNNKR